MFLLAEIGDYHPSEHKEGYVSEFRFVPHQDESFEAEVARLHAEYTYVEMITILY